jgi:hypothetical protein
MKRDLKVKRKVVPRLTPADIEARLVANKLYSEAVMAIFDVAPAWVKRRAHKDGDYVVMVWYQMNQAYVDQLIEREKQREALDNSDRER